MFGQADLPSPPGRRQRSRLVGLMRLLLPGIAIGLVVMVVAWPKIFGEVAGTITSSGGLLSGFTITDPMRMRNPRYVGTDTEGGRPYEVTADEAKVDPQGPNRIELTRMRGTLTGAQGGNTTLTAEFGIYLRDVGTLDMYRNVVLTTADGTRFTTQHAFAHLHDKTAEGERPVHGVGPRGTLDAQNFRIEQGGDVIRFGGGVRGVLVQADGAAATQDQGKQP
jgi:lipopolysaccharide export system protein LptC